MTVSKKKPSIARTSTPVEVAKALKTIAQFFSVPKKITRRDGTTDVVNGLDFAQRFLLGDLCWQADKAVSYTQSKLDEQKSAIVNMGREYDGTEIARTKLQRAADTAKSLAAELEVKENYLVLTKSIYHQVTDKHWSPVSKLPADKPSVDIEALAIEYGFEVATVGADADTESSVDDSQDLAAAG